MSTVNRTIIACMGVTILFFTILIVYRTQQPATVSLLEPHEGIYFTAPRVIKQFHLVDTNQQEFDGKNVLHHWSILFFGFTHCNEICPMTLAKLSQTIDVLAKKNVSAQVIFITLDPAQDTPQTLKKYLQHFHRDIIGVTGKISEIRKLQSQLGIYANENLAAHSPSILLINPDAKWTAKLSGDLSPGQLAEVIQIIVQEKQ